MPSFVSDLIASLLAGDLLHDPLALTLALLGLGNLVQTAWYCTDHSGRRHTLAIAIDVITAATCMAFWVLPATNRHTLMPATTLFAYSALALAWHAIATRRALPRSPSSLPGPGHTAAALADRPVIPTTSRS